MDYSTLGTSDLNISRIGLGTMMIGWRANVESAQDMILSALDHGVNFIDTSVSYSRGKCHEIIGDVFKKTGTRNKFVLATKVGGIANDDDPAHFRGYSKANIIRQCELSLKQLKTDVIDLLQLHQPSEEVAVAESLGAIRDLIARGLVRYAGVCNYSATQMAKALEASKSLDVPRLISNQVPYNLIDRSYEKDVFSAAKSDHVGIITWGPLCGGLLSDWYTGSESLKPSGRLDSGREREQKLKLLHTDPVKRLLKNLSAYAEKRHMSIQQLAVSWVLANENVSCVLLGPTTLTQWIELLSTPHTAIRAEAAQWPSAVSTKK